MSTGRAPLRNAGLTLAQVVVSGATLFFLYRFLLSSIGPSAMGIWAVVLATTAASRLSDLGLTASVVRFVARALAREQTTVAAATIETASITIGVVLGVALFLVYPLFRWAVTHLLPSATHSEALPLIPYALVGFWLTAQASVFQSGLDGCKRFDLRNATSLGGNVLYLLAALVFVPRFGLRGMGFVQVVQSGILMLSAWALLKYALPELWMFPFRWSRSIFFEMLGYGVNFQIVGVTSLLFDLTTKGLLSKFGSLVDVTYFDMANRMVMQVRLMIVSANQVAVPYVATMSERAPARLQEMYRQSYEILSYLALAIFGGLLSIIPIISLLWLGRFDRTFIVFAAILSVGWGLNVLSGPAYFANLGTGRLYWNTWGHITLGLVNAVLGFALGSIVGSFGIICALSIALILGSGLIVTGYHRENTIPLRMLLGERNGQLLLATSAALLAGWSLARTLAFSPNSSMAIVITVSVPAALIATALWVHPVRAATLARIRGQIVQSA